MLQQVYGIKQFQTHLPAIAREINQMGGHFLITKRNDPAFVALSFEDYQEMVEMVLEKNSPQLQKHIIAGRKAYDKGETTSLADLKKELSL